MKIAPKPAVGDGPLGFRASVCTEWPDIAEQLCWVREAAMAGDGDRIRELTQEREALAAELGPLEEEWAGRAEA